jgi:hypothetical protein
MELCRTKNDPKGVLNIEDRTYTISCACLDSDEVTKKEKNKFISDSSTNLQFTCLFGCPFQLITNYLSMLPDRFGAEQKKFVDNMIYDKSLDDKVDIRPLKFMRARVAKACGGTKRSFIKSPLGIHQMRDINQRINSNLPKELQVIFV